MNAPMESEEMLPISNCRYSPKDSPARMSKTPPQITCGPPATKSEGACWAGRNKSEPIDQMRDARSKIDIPQARWCCDEPVNAGPTKIPTPTNPPNKPSQTRGVGRAAVPLSQPSSAISIGTVATSNAANPVGTHCSEMVTPPFPPRSKQPPTIAAVLQVWGSGLDAP